MMEELGAFKETDAIRSAILSDPNVYRGLAVKPTYKEEKILFRTERLPKGEAFSRLDHIVVRHGKQLKELFNTEDENAMLSGIVDTLKESQDQYRDEETGHLVFFNEKNNLTIIVKDKLSQENSQNPPPPPPYITTAYTLAGGKASFESRKEKRAIH